MKTISNAEIKGGFASPFSVKPLKNAWSLNSKLVSYLEDLRKTHNSSVFKFHPGLKTIACLDNDSAVFYFNAPESILARENKRRFGSLALQPKLLAGTCPALVSTGEEHTRARNFTDEIFKERAKHLKPSFDKVSERLLKKWETSTNLNLYNIIVEWSSNITSNWILDMDVKMEHAKQWLNASITVDTDTKLTQVLGKFILPKCPHSAIQIQQEMKRLVKQSPLFEKYLELSKKNNISEEYLSEFLIFLAFFNGTAAPTYSLYYAITKIYATPKLLKKLRKELTGASTEEVFNNPLLDNVFHEGLRLNAVPKVYFKKAQCDFLMPAGDGKSYEIKKDDLILIPATISHLDPKVFENPEDFNPSRYEKNPELKDKVFGFGITKETKNTYGCAANVNMEATWFWKNMFAKFITSIDFDFTEKPTFDLDAFYCFYPGSIKMKNVQILGREFSKSEEERRANNSILNEKFYEFSKKVKNKDIEFNKKQYLQLYGLYKQINNGNNNTSPPSRLKVLATEKWISWNRQKGLSGHEAMFKYVEIASGEKLDLKLNLENIIKKPELIEDVEIKVTHSISDEVQTTNASFLIEAEDPNIGSQIELEIILHGSEGKSNPIKVLLPEITTSRIIKWSVDIPIIGKPEVIYLAVKSLDENDLGNWFIKKIKVNLENVDVFYGFSHNATIPIPSSQNIIFETSGFLPKEESSIQNEARKLYIEQKQKQYRWNIKKGYPGEVDYSDYGELPLDEQFQEKSISTKTADSYVEQENPTSFEYYADRLKGIDRKLPRVVKDDLWMKDQEFGRLYLQGTHCNFFKRCLELPKELNLNESFKIPKANCTLQELIDKKLLYIADYELLKETKPTNDYYIAAPIVLLYSELSTQQLLPIGIQLDRDKDAVVFTPEDTKNDWLLAKMWARVADISVHQIYSHFLLNHSVTEAFVVAAHRTLTPTHPVFQILQPHFKFTLCINTVARTALLNKGGWIDRFFSFGGNVQEKVMEKAYKNTSIKDYMNFSRDIEKRGVNDLDRLPYYPYRDDGLLVWEAIKKYVKDILKIYYKTDLDVAEDTILKEWLTEFSTKGYLYSDWGAIETINGLEDLLASFLFNATANHGSMNILQYETYGFIPFSPPAMLNPPPRVKGVTTAKDILDTLPGTQMLQVYLFLSERFEEDVKLARNEFIYSCDSDFRYEELQFRLGLDNIEKIINDRNNTRKVPYISMLPSNIPNSIDL